VHVAGGNALAKMQRRRGKSFVKVFCSWFYNL